MSVDELIELLQAILAIQPDHQRAKPWLEKARSSEQLQKRSQLRGDKIGQIIEIPLANSLKMSFAWVPPGKSWLGSGGGKPGTEEFTLSQGLWCGIYSVTQTEWQAITGNNPSHFNNKPGSPVEKASWNQVDAFIQKLNSRFSGRGLTYRLPTEKEGEYI